MISSIRYKVIVDTNVFISGAIYGGNSEKILNLISDSRLDLLISQEVFNELFDTLSDFKTSRKVIRSLEKLFLLHSTLLSPIKRITLCRDPKDNKFLELAWEGRADYLISGDKDLLSLKSFKSTRIVSPKEFLTIIRR